MVKSTEKSDPTRQDSSEATQAVLDSAEPTAAPAVESSDRIDPPPPQQRPVQSQLKLDESKAIACYANFCRVTGTPEELIIDFGLNNQPMGIPLEPIPITQRLVVNFYTAKRMLAALQMSIQRHEAAFGVLETDVQRRGLPNAWRQERQARG